MKDKAKEDFRSRTFNQIEKLDELVQNLSATAKLRSEYPVDHALEDIGPGPEDVEVCPVWDIRWQYDLEEVGNRLFFESIDKLYEMLNSKEGVRMYPRGIYRELIEFSDKCESCNRWKGEKKLRVAIDAKGTPSNAEILVEASGAMKKNTVEFRNEIKAIMRSIKYYENAREENEESFFGSANIKAGS